MDQLAYIEPQAKRPWDVCDQKGLTNVIGITIYLVQGCDWKAAMTHQKKD